MHAAEEAPGGPVQGRGGGFIHPAGGSVTSLHLEGGLPQRFSIQTQINEEFKELNLGVYTETELMSVHETPLTSTRYIHICIQAKMNFNAKISNPANSGVMVYLPRNSRQTEEEKTVKRGFEWADFFLQMEFR